MKTIVSEKGQITIPKALRSCLGLTPGTVLDFYESKGKLVAEKKVAVKNPMEKWLGTGKLPFGRTVDEYIRICREG